MVEKEQEKITGLWVRIRDVWIEVLNPLTVWPWKSYRNDLCVLIHKKNLLPSGSKTSHLSILLGQCQLLNMVLYIVEGWTCPTQPKGKIKLQELQSYKTKLLPHCWPPSTVFPGSIYLVSVKKWKIPKDMCSWSRLIYSKFYK